MRFPGQCERASKRGLGRVQVAAAVVEIGCIGERVGERRLVPAPLLERDPAPCRLEREFGGTASARGLGRFRQGACGVREPADPLGETRRGEEHGGGPLESALRRADGEAAREPDADAGDRGRVALEVLHRSDRRLAVATSERALGAPERRTRGGVVADLPLRLDVGGQREDIGPGGGCRERRGGVGGPAREQFVGDQPRVWVVRGGERPERRAVVGGDRGANRRRRLLGGRRWGGLSRGGWRRCGDRRRRRRRRVRCDAAAGGQQNRDQRDPPHRAPRSRSLGGSADRAQARPGGRAVRMSFGTTIRVVRSPHEESLGQFVPRGAGPRGPLPRPMPDTIAPGSLVRRPEANRRPLRVGSSSLSRRRCP